MYILTVIIKILLIAVPLLLAVAWFTLLERKIMAGIHRRRGPNVVGAWGLLQPLADGLKLILKETILPSACYSIELAWYSIQSPSVFYNPSWYPIEAS